MIKVIVVDDEWYNLEEICELVEKTGLMSVCGRYQNPLKALGEVANTLPQVAFVDIELPEMDGITLAEKLLEIQPGIIIVFITSWNKYAVQAFDINALDYIMKPIKLERFNRMVEKIRSEISLRPTDQSNLLKIRCFNHLETFIGSIPVKWERAKAEELFAYLLMNHGCYVHKDTIMDNLWPEYVTSKALPILQTAICKIRNVLSKTSKDVILDYSGSKYCISIMNADCDFFEVESALAHYRCGDRTTYISVLGAADTYGKGFLTRQGYLWSIQKDEELRKKLTIQLKEIISDYSLKQEFKELSKTLKQLVELTPYDDDANYSLLSTLVELGDYKGVLMHYQWLSKVLRDEFDTIPSDRIKEIFNIVSRE